MRISLASSARLLLGVLLLASALPPGVGAQGPSLIVVVLKDGTRHTFNARDVTRIDFELTGISDWNGANPTPTASPTPAPTPAPAPAPAPAGRGAGRYLTGDITFQGAWETLSGSQLAGGSARRTASVGATASFTFHGSSISLISKIQPDAGVAEVYVDDQLVMTHPQYGGASQWEDQRVVLLKSGLDPNSSHVVKVVKAGGTNPFGKPAWVTVNGFIVQ